MALYEEETVERTLCQVRTVHVFKIPPRVSAGGYRASDWKEEVWQGSLKIIQKNLDAAILLTDPKNGTLFAMCPVKEGAVERCVDSSRYFVLKIQNAQGRHAFVGVAFNEREEAFDFNVALQEYEKDKEREEKLKAGGSILEDGAGGNGSGDNGPKLDLSLKEGEKLSIKLPTREGDQRKKRVTTATGGGGGGGGGGLLLPPPGSSSGLLAPPAPASAGVRKPQAQQAAAHDNFLEALGGETPASTPAPASTTSSVSHEFASFMEPIKPSTSSTAPPPAFGSSSSSSRGSGSNHGFDALSSAFSSFPSAPSTATGAGSSSKASPFDSLSAMGSSLPQVGKPMNGSDPFADLLPFK